MEYVAMIVAVTGLFISLIGTIWFLIVAFSESILWGLGCLLIPFIPLIFLILHWREAAKPVIVWVIGAVIIGVGTVMMPETPSFG